MGSSPPSQQLPSTTSSSSSSKILFLHGLLGQGRNLKTFANKVCQIQNQIGILMDLRGHGKSRLHSQPPLSSSTNTTRTSKTGNDKTTFADCVADIELTLGTTTTATTSDGRLSPPTIIVGHSWGGRMAIQYAHQNPTSIEQVWLLDVVPGKANESVEKVIETVTRLQQRYQEQQNNKAEMTSSSVSRKELMRQLTQEEGMDLPTATWLASSYHGPTGDFGFDLSVVRDILPEFATQDLEGMIIDLIQQQGQHTNNNKAIQVHVVRAGKNPGWDKDILNRFDTLQHDFPNRFMVHLLPNAGHWVHVDDLKGLVSLFVANSPPS